MMKVMIVMALKMENIYLSSKLTCRLNPVI